ncbi:hypothetical protein F53441_1356 [Fusarium austroafricanum]|uniref:Plastocyanin-like domain-containing protein n=1 Tax=Fusarium austroafricanum TaxID=2364996 RepID=A0A8H4NZ26_9HYPO|nr:hypothetical protein F53441_1356 [Fusarium austroafricanum]
MGLYTVGKAIIVYTASFFFLPLHEHSKYGQPDLSLRNDLSSRNYPEFPAPNGPDTDEDFICTYPDLGDEWKSCSTPEDRGYLRQRYHVVLHAEPNSTATHPAADDGNYWIRMVPADGCSNFEFGNTPDERQGILRYDPESTAVASTFRGNWSLACQDEDCDKLKPILPWTIPRVDLYKRNTSDDLGTGVQYEGMDNLSQKITRTDGHFFPGAHPMHLHGHDFVLLAQGTNSSQVDDPNNPITLKFDNPPRRDVALLPAGGYLIVAFRAENPGSWLFHCHIAWHASNGLALQIMEREEEYKKLMTPERLEQVNDGCKKWKEWYTVPENHGNPKGVFQDDAGG